VYEERQLPSAAWYSADYRTATVTLERLLNLRSRSVVVGNYFN